MIPAACCQAAFPTAGGLSSADLIAVLAIVVTVFGLLLTAIGVLTLRQFTNADHRISEVKSDLTADIAQIRTDLTNGLTSMRVESHEQSTAIWAEIRFLRTWLSAPEAPPLGPSHPGIPRPGGGERRITD